MKKLIVCVILSLCMVVFLSPAALASPFVPPDYEPGVPIDWDEDGVIDVYATVISGVYQEIPYIYVAYSNVQQFKNNKNKFAVVAQGFELWAEGYGIIYDTYKPWTYPFSE